MESRKSLKTKLKAIKKALGAQDLNQHFVALQSAIDAYEEPKKAEVDINNLALPKEISSGNDFALFSDGACRGNPGPGAWAYVIQDSEGKIISKEKDFSQKTTNNRMELAGAIEALKYVKSQSIQGNFFLYTDSRYLVDGIEKWIHSWKKRGWKKADKKEPENIELWKALDSLNEELSVSFKWVKGHAGHPQNELCDKLANEALDEAGY